MVGRRVGPNRLPPTAHTGPGRVTGESLAQHKAQMRMPRRRHDINPQAYLTQLLANLPATPLSRLDEWLPDQWQRRQPTASDDRSLAEI